MERGFPPRHGAGDKDDRHGAEHGVDPQFGGMMAFVYPGVAENYYIMLLSAAIITHGSGLFGADDWLAKRA